MTGWIGSQGISTSTTKRSSWAINGTRRTCLTHRSGFTSDVASSVSKELYGNWSRRENGTAAQIVSERGRFHCKRVRVDYQPLTLVLEAESLPLMTSLAI